MRQMDENNLKRMLQGQRQGPSKRSWRCPDDARLAAYADQQLPGHLKESIENHLANCDSCLAEVSFLVKSSELPDPQPVPAQVLSRARSLVSQNRSSSVWGWRWTIATAAVACLVFAILLGIAAHLRESRKAADESLLAKNLPPQPAVSQFPSPATVETPPRLDSPGPKRTESPRPVNAPAPGVRRPLGSGALAPNVLFPTERAMVASGDLVVRWTPVNEAAFYEVTLVTDAGDVVFAGRSTDAQLKLPAQVKLTAGSKYFVQVTANMPQGNTIKSSVVGFRISH